MGQIPIYYNHYNTGRPTNKEGNIFWSHYNDVENTPLFPFGYGLSYTTFEYSDLKIKQLEKFEIEVSVQVENSGKVQGEEVVQLYIRDKVASVVRPVKELKGFKKIHLTAGEIQRIDFKLSEKELGFFNGNGDYLLEEGEFDIMVGGNSTDLIIKTITIN